MYFLNSYNDICIYDDNEEFDGYFGYLLHFEKSSVEIGNEKSLQN